MKRVIALCLVLLIFVVGCDLINQGEEVQVQTNLTPQEPTACPEDAKVCPDGSTVVRVLPDCEFEECPEIIEPVVCEKNTDCEEGLLCIDDSCQEFNKLYVSEGCETKCKVTGITVLTSDGEEYDLTPGRGSYSYAGAIEWKLKSTPEYCQGEEPLVPITILKKSLGEVLGESLITIKEGATSRVITHPTVSRVQFTATLVSVTEECS